MVSYRVVLFVMALVIVLGASSFFVSKVLQTAFQETPEGQVPQEIYSYREAALTSGFDNDIALCGSKFSYSSTVFDGGQPAPDNLDPIDVTNFATCVQGGRGECSTVSVPRKDFSNIKDLLKVEVSADNFFEKSINVVKINVDSSKDVQAKAFVWVRFQTPNGYGYRDLSTNKEENSDWKNRERRNGYMSSGVVLKQGINDLEYVLPTDLPVLASSYDFFIVFVDTKVYDGWRNEADFSDAGSSGSPTVTIPYQNCIGNTRLIQLSQLVRKEFLISPIDLYQFPDASGNCGVNYVKPTLESKYCIRDDFKSFPCYRLGCPIRVNPDGSKKGMACSNAGICVDDPVYHVVESKEECDFESQVYDSESGACVNKVVFEAVGECSVDSDCYNACPEQITSTCIDGKCKQDRQCDVPEEIKEYVEEVRERQEQASSSPSQVESSGGVAGITDPKVEVVSLPKPKSETGLLAFLSMPLVWFALIGVVVVIFLVLWLVRRR